MFKEDSKEFIDKSSIGIHTVSADGLIGYANQCELDTLGYSESEYVGHHVSEFQMDKEALSDMMRRLNDFDMLKNYPSKVQGKKAVKYILYNSSVYVEGHTFIHTRCYGIEIAQPVYDVFYSQINSCKYD